MKQIFQVLLVGFLFSFSGCFGTKDENTLTENPIFENTTDYSLSIPQEWEVFPKAEYTQSIVFSAREPAYTSRIPSIIAVAKEESSPSSIEELMKRNLEEVRRESQDFKQITEETVDIANAQSRFVEYQERNSKDNSVFSVYSLYVLPNESDHSYIITLLFDGESDDAKKKALKEIVTSFSVEKKSE